MNQNPPEGAIIVTGYKATDVNIRCRGYQFEVGAWHKHEGEVVECVSGFHFCEQPSGPWSYYTSSDARVWRIEAADVLEAEWSPGTDRKRVARYIRLVEEVAIGGNGNTGDGNTGNYNTGNRNTGYRNTGNYNTGYRNTGDGNTGDGNTGDYNTGRWNTGNRNTGSHNTGGGNAGDRNTGNYNTRDRNTGNYNNGGGNTGNWNTGDRNTGYGNTGNRNTGGYNAGNRNTGNRNTGNRNTGDWNAGECNTGDGNATDFSAGYFCQEPQTTACFDLDTGLSRDEFAKRYGAVAERLALRLQSREPIPFDEYAALPGITPEKLASLHAKHLAARTKEEPK